MLALFCAVAQAYTYDSGRNQDRSVRPNQLPDSNEGCAKGAIAISLFLRRTSPTSPFGAG